MSNLNSLMNFVGACAIAFALGYFVFVPRPAAPPPDDAAFLAAINGPGPVIVKFGADWCPPCRQVEGELDALAAQSAGQIQVVKINVDERADLARHYQVSGIPRLLLFRRGKLLDDRTGAMSREDLKSWVETHP